MPWVKIQLIERPYYDPRTDEILSSIEGLRNRPNIDPFEGGGKVYPEEALKLKILARREKGTTLLLLLDEPKEKIDQVKSLVGAATFQASPKTVQAYDLADHRPGVMSDAEALDALKGEIGLPEETTLDARGVPVLPAFLAAETGEVI